MANRDIKRGDRSRSSRAPALSFFGINLLPAFSRDGNPQHHRPAHHHRSHNDRDRDRDRDQNKDRAKGRDRFRDEGRGGAARAKERDGTHEKNTARVSIDLEDLDGLHDPYNLAVKRGIDVAKLEAFVRARCQDSKRPLSETDRVRFYADARELARHELIDSYPCIWFRVVTPRDNDTWKFTHMRDDTNGRLDTPLTDEMIRCIEAGNTLGQLRKLVAGYMDIEDPNRIIVIARDGARRGLLQGDMWELRQIRSWFCRWLSIDVSPQKSYVIVEGPWGQYLFHPYKDFSASRMVAKDVKKWMEARLLNNVDRLHNSKLKLKWLHISLTYKNGRLSNSCPIIAGARYKFELPWYLEDMFAAEESWLLAASETCTVCADDKKPTELPGRISGSCKHKPTICKECLAQWIHSSLDTSSWDRLRCPECPELLKFDGVRRYASKEDFDRYDTLATRAALKAIPNFRWCLSTSCESGQIHDPTCRKFKCTACKARHCIFHEVPWHSNETCEEYDHRNRRRKKEEKASEETIKKTSKACPNCQRAVHKFTGCNHITCLCGHEWCYVCAAPFRRNQQGFLYCRHNPGCTETDPFADIVDPHGRPRMPNNMPNVRHGPHPFRPPGVGVPPQHGNNQQEARNGLPERMFDRMRVALEEDLDRPRVHLVGRHATARRPRAGNRPEEALNRAGNNVEAPQNTGHEDRHRQEDPFGALARVWADIADHDGRRPVAAGMAHNHHLLLQHALGRHVEMDELVGHLQEFGLFDRFPGPA